MSKQTILDDIRILRQKGVSEKIYALEELRCLTKEELAGIVGPWCTAVIIDGWIRKNGLPASKLGKRLVVTVGDFRQWVKENKVKIFRIA